MTNYFYCLGDTTGLFASTNILPLVASVLAYYSSLYCPSRNTEQFTCIFSAHFAVCYTCNNLSTFRTTSTTPSLLCKLSRSKWRQFRLPEHIIKEIYKNASLNKISYNRLLDGSHFASFWRPYCFDNSGIGFSKPVVLTNSLCLSRNLKAH